MEDNGISLFGGGTINLDGIQPSVVDDEIDEEEERNWNIDLQKAVRDAFDDLEDEHSQEHSSLYSVNQLRVSDTEICTTNGEHSHHNMANYEQLDEEEIQGSPPEYNDNQSSLVDGHHTPSAWSDKSDLSGNFITHDSVISPTRFHLNMNNVISRSDDSVSVSKEQQNYEYDEYRTNPSSSDQNYENRPNYYSTRNEAVSQADYLSTETSYEQLQLLYEARGREIDRLTEELNKLKLASGHEISSLKQQMAFLKADKETLLTSRDQLKHLFTESEARIRSLSSDLKEKDKLLETHEVEHKKFKLQMNTAEGTIISLERQVAELQSVDSIARSRQAHEDFLQKLQNSHHEEVEEMKRKLKFASGRAAEFESQIKSLEEDLATIRKSKEIILQEKSEVICQLNTSLEAARQQVKVLLNTRHKDHSFLGESTTKYETNELSKRLALTEAQLQQANKNLESYDMLLKLGFFKSVMPNSCEDSVDQLNLCKVLTFDDTTLPSNSKHIAGKHVPESNINEKMKQELLKSLYSNKKYREEIERLNEGINEKQKFIKIKESELKSLKETLKQKEDSKASEENVRNKLLIIEENTCLKKEITVFIENFEAVRERGEEMINTLRGFFKSDKVPPYSLKKMPTTIGVPEAIKEYTKVMEKFGKIYHEMWEDLREDNLQLNSKRYLIVNNFESLLECLKELKSDLKLKAMPDSSDFMTLKQLMDTFTLSIKELKEEMFQYFHGSSKLKNELWTIRLSFERTKNDNSILKTKVKTLEEEMKKIEKEKMQTIENCKENYLKFHEETVCKLRENLQNEYNVIITSLKEEVKRISNELTEAQNNYLEICREKKNSEEMYKKRKEGKNLCREEDFFQENLIKENEKLKKTLDNLKTKYTTLERELNRQLVIHSQINSRKNEEEGLSITENVELIEARQKVVHLSDEVQRLEAEVAQLESKHSEEKCILNEEVERIEKQVRGSHPENSTDKAEKFIEAKNASFTVSHIFDVVEKYKKLNDDLREDKEKLKSYFEKQIQGMNNQIELGTHTTSHIIAQTRSSCEKETKEEIKVLKDKVNDLSTSINRLEEEKANLIACHEQEVKILTDEIHNQESSIKEMKHEWKIHLHDQMKDMHELNVRKLKYEQDIIILKENEDLLNQKYSKLKNKFFRLKRNFEEYRTWSQERENHLFKESERLLKEKSEDNQKQFDNFKEWLTNCRTILTDGVWQVIEELKSIPERALPYSILEPHINALIVIHKGLLKLDIRDKICFTTSAFKK